MGSSLPITQFVILRPKQGIRLENVASRAADTNSSDATAKAFLNLTDITKAQEGFISQCWGHQVENPDLFVWCLNWRSFEDDVKFVESEAHTSFIQEIRQLFELPPYMLYSRWDEYEPEAFNAPVSEIAFFTFVNGVTDEVKKEFRKETKGANQLVKTAGKSIGYAGGWVFIGKPEPKEGVEWLTGVYSYESVEAHMKWRATPEHEAVGEIFDELDKRGICLDIARSVPGIDPETGYFHVKFEHGS